MPWYSPAKAHGVVGEPRVSMLLLVTGVPLSIGSPDGRFPP